MLKRSITYTDFNDQQVTDVVYFNLSKSELIEMELGTKETFSDMLQRIVETKENDKLILIFKQLILAAYGQKSSDGKKFDKNDEMRDEFSRTAAYDALFMELATSDGAAVAFIKGIMPQDMLPQLEKAFTPTDTPEAMIKRAQDAVNANAGALLPPPSTV